MNKVSKLFFQLVFIYGLITVGAFFFFDDRGLFHSFVFGLWLLLLNSLFWIFIFLRIFRRTLGLSHPGRQFVGVGSLVFLGSTKVVFLGAGAYLGIVVFDLSAGYLVGGAWLGLNTLAAVFYGFRHQFEGFFSPK